MEVEKRFSNLLWYQSSEEEGEKKKRKEKELYSGVKIV